jgi:hypothetical protein
MGLIPKDMVFGFADTCEEYVEEYEATCQVMTEGKFRPYTCVHCEHREEVEGTPMCIGIAIYDLVDGGLRPASCAEARGEGGLCGKDGRFYIEERRENSDEEQAKQCQPPFERS